MNCSLRNKNRSFVFWAEIWNFFLKIWLKAITRHTAAFLHTAAFYITVLFNQKGFFSNCCAKCFKSIHIISESLRSFLAVTLLMDSWVHSRWCWYIRTPRNSWLEGVFSLFQLAGWSGAALSLGSHRLYPADNPDGDPGPCLKPPCLRPSFWPRPSSRTSRSQTLNPPLVPYLKREKLQE